MRDSRRVEGSAVSIGVGVWGRGQWSLHKGWPWVREEKRQGDSFFVALVKTPEPSWLVSVEFIIVLYGLVSDEPCLLQATLISQAKILSSAQHISFFLLLFIVWVSVLASSPVSLLLLLLEERGCGGE